MLQLSELLFEGLLKLPENLVKQVYDFGVALFAKRQLLKISEFENFIKNVKPKQKIQITDAVNNLAKICRQESTLNKIKENRNYETFYLGFYINEESLTTTELQMAMGYLNDIIECFLWIKDIESGETKEKKLFDIEESDFISFFKYDIYDSDIYYELELAIGQEMKQYIDSEILEVLKEVKVELIKLSKDIEIDEYYYKKENSKVLWHEFEIKQKDIPYLAKHEFLNFRSDIRGLGNREFTALKLNVAFWHKKEYFNNISRSGQEKASGHYIFYDKKPKTTMELALPEMSNNMQEWSIYDIRDKLKIFETTIRHEFGHLMQDILTVSKTKKTTGEHLFSGNNKFQYGVNSKKISKENQRNIDWGDTPHSLRDIEFYPNTETEFNILKNELKNIEPRKRLEYFKNSVSKIKLRNTNPGKFKKLVSLLYNALKEEGYF
jgi:hypothetical protein